ncbi:hypothetical protein TNCV_1546741 [Trichonephila clavipes]|nr:hypothetical protein TNCV_1546741 [Trichonephila clavipes]
MSGENFWRRPGPTQGYRAPEEKEEDQQLPLPLCVAEDSSAHHTPAGLTPRSRRPRKGGRQGERHPGGWDAQPVEADSRHCYAG